MVSEQICSLYRWFLSYDGGCAAQWEDRDNKIWFALESNKWQNYVCLGTVVKK